MIYRIKDDFEHYLISGLGHSELRKVHDNFPIVRRILSQSSTNESVKDLWKHVDFHMHDGSSDKKGTLMPDITQWKCGFILKNSAFECLHEHLAPFGEFLDASVNGESVHLFSCLTFGKEDMTQSIVDYADGIPVGLEHLVFDEKDIEDKLVFKSKRQYGGVLYCGDQFKVLCELHGLKGLRFDTDLLNIF